MVKYTSLHNPSMTPQTQPAPGKAQVPNAAGGYAFELSALKRAERFLILGSDSPTYYASAQKLTRENAGVIAQLWETDPEGLAALIVEISEGGRAAKNDPAIYALALGALAKNEKAHALAYAAVRRVCRTSTHLFQWINACMQMGHGHGGRGWKRAVLSFYTNRDVDGVAFQAIKYREREGMNHSRALNFTSRGPRAKAYGEEVDYKRIALYNWINGKPFEFDALPRITQGHLKAMEAKTAKEWVKLIEDYKLPWEALPTEAMREKDVYEALLPHMGLTALIRNLGAMSELGVLTPMGGRTAEVVARLMDDKELKKARIHPFNLLVALDTYGAGKGFRGKRTWPVIAKISKALDSAFYLSFKTVEPTGKRHFLALDVSGSMGSPNLMNSQNITPMVAAAAMALVTENVEGNSAIFGFSTKLTPLNIHSGMTLDAAVKAMRKMPMGGTDCAQPMLYAMENRLPVDVFCVYTDNETWAGRIHPFQALDKYRQAMGISAKLVVVGMTSTWTSIGDKDDAGTLDVVGFDTATPSLISNFVRG